MNSSDELLQERKPIRPKTLETVTRQLDREHLTNTRTMRQPIGQVSTLLTFEIEWHLGP